MSSEAALAIQFLNIIVKCFRVRRMSASVGCIYSVSVFHCRYSGDFMSSKWPVSVAL